MRLARHYAELNGVICNNTNLNNEIIVKFVSQAQCSVTTSCLSLLKYNDEIPCLRHLELKERLIRQNLQGEGYCRQFRTKPCGLKCCLTTITMNCDFVIVKQFGNYNFTFLPKQFSTLSECPPSTIDQCHPPFIDNPPIIILPCVGDCEKG